MQQGMASPEGHSCSWQMLYSWDDSYCKLLSEQPTRQPQTVRKDLNCNPGSKLVTVVFLKLQSMCCSPGGLSPAGDLHLWVELQC